MGPQRTALLVSSATLLLGCSDHRGFSVGTGALRTVAFETRSEIPTGLGDMADAATADFNGDRKPDLVVSSIAGTVQVLLGQGNGLFGLAQSIAVAGIPSFLATGDVDSDGDQDFVVLRSQAERMATYRNDGAGNFSLGAEAPIGSGPQELVIGDIDGDGKLDAGITSWSSNQVTFLRGVGDGSFAAGTPWTMPAGAQPLGIAVGDLDRDGASDVVVTDQAGDRIGVFYGRGRGLFDAPVFHAVGDGPVAVTIGDISNDGHADLVVSNLDEQSLTLLRRLDVRQYRVETMRTDGAPSFSAVGDITGDGVNDLVVSVFSRASASLYPGRGNGSLGNEMQFGITGLPLRPLIVNVNPDAGPIQDLVVSAVLGDRLSLVFGGNGLPVTSLNYAAGVQLAEAVATADFDGDGVAELAAGGIAEPVLAISSLNDSPATRTRALVPMMRVDLPAPPFNIVSGDYDKDGRIDLAVATKGGVVLLANRRDGNGLRFEPITGSGFLVPAVGAYEIAAGDLDGNRLLDLVITSVVENKVKILRARGPGFDFETTPAEIDVPGGPLGVALADFDGDTDLDIAVSRNQASFVNLYANDGSARFALLAEAPVGAAPNYLRTADFNGDNRADLVVSNGLGDNISVLVAGQRPGAFVPQDIRVGDRPTALLTRDLNRDGNPDILVASLLGADFHVLLGDGRGAFPTKTRFPGTYLATTADLADMNADGLPDLAVGSTRTTRVSLYRNVSR